MEGYIVDINIKDKIALVTGGSYGIGKFIALQLAQEGCKVAICARSEPKLHQTAEELLRYSQNVLPIKADACRDVDIKNTITSIVDKWGGIDILVNNVGGGGAYQFSIGEAPDEVWENAYILNSLATKRFTLAAIPHMQKSGWGRVIAISSVAGKEAAKQPWYGMSKASQISFIKSFSRHSEYVRNGITFNSIAVGRVIISGNEWDLFRVENESLFNQRIQTAVPIGRCASPQEVASAVTFLCSSQASFINGACLTVDGGESMSF